MNFTIRKATIDDAALLARARYQHQIAEGKTLLIDTREALLDFYTRHLTDGSLVSYIAEVNGQLAATAGLLFQEYPPSIHWNAQHRGYVTDVYTEKPYRGQGIATALIERIIADAREKKLGCLWLFASGMGHPIYEKLGFTVRAADPQFMEWREPPKP